MLRLVNYSDTLAVSLEEATLHLRRENRDDDTLVKTFIRGASKYVEKFTGIALVDQEWDFFFNAFPDGLDPYGRYITIPRPPLLEVEGVFYRNSAEAEFTNYLVDYSEPPSASRIFLLDSASWPTTDGGQNAGRIRFRAGYLDESSPGIVNEIPPDIKAAILMILGSMYENRETVSIGAIPYMIPWGAENLLRMYRAESSLA